MSIEVILIPIGIAAYSALKEYRRSDLCEGCQQTRITEPALLVQALRDVGATQIEVDGQTLTAQSGHGQLRFQVVDGHILGRVDGGSVDETALMLGEIDAAVGRILQAQKVEEMRTRAAQLGLVLVGEELAEDGTVQMVFEEA
jgi:hypothetical protein